MHMMCIQDMTHWITADWNHSNTTCACFQKHIMVCSEWLGTRQQQQRQQQLLFMCKIIILTLILQFPSITNKEQSNLTPLNKLPLTEFLSNLWYKRLMHMQVQWNFCTTTFISIKVYSGQTISSPKFSRINVHISIKYRCYSYNKLGNNQQDNLTYIWEITLSD